MNSSAIWEIIALSHAFEEMYSITQARVVLGQSRFRSTKFDRVIAS